MMAVYLGVNGEVKKISAIQYKNENGIAIVPLKADAGMATFTTSGIFTVPDGVTSIDVFCVGGGGAGGVKTQGWGGNTMICGDGGGSGFTKTVCGISVSQGEEIPVIVGAGQTKAYDSNGTEAQAGTSSCKSCSAKGGYSGSVNNNGNNRSFGGSGGGRGGSANYKTSDSTFNDSDIEWVCGGGIGGIDGGPSKQYLSDGSLHDDIIGQGTTTRAFGDYGNTCYAGGGGGGSINPSYAYYFPAASKIKYGSPGTASYGGGRGAYARNTKGYDGVDGTGGGGGGSFYISYNQTPSKGGDGIVIIRWGHQI